MYYPDLNQLPGVLQHSFLYPPEWRLSEPTMRAHMKLFSWAFAAARNAKLREDRADAPGG